MPELAPTFRRLDEMTSVAPTAHPHGAERVSERAVVATKTPLVLANVRFSKSVSARIVPYFVGPIPDGGVQLKWRSDHAQLWLMAYPSGGYGYLYEDRTRPGAFEESDDIPLQEALRLVGKALLPPARPIGGE